MNPISPKRSVALRMHHYSGKGKVGFPSNQSASNTFGGLMSWTKTFSVTTDENGNYKNSQSASVPLVPVKNLDVKARLLNGAGIRIDGSIDIDAVDGSPTNEPKRFTLLGEGDWFYVGKFRVDFGVQSYQLELSGTTTPATPNTELSIEVEAW